MTHYICSLSKPAFMALDERRLCLFTDTQAHDMNREDAKTECQTI